MKPAGLFTVLNSLELGWCAFWPRDPRGPIGHLHKETFRRFKTIRVEAENYVRYKITREK